MAKKNQVAGVVSTLLQGVHDLSRSETIVGEPQQAGDATIIPIHRLRLTFAAGTGKAGAHGTQLGGDYEGYAAGGAIDLDPVAAIAIDSSGKAQLLTVDSDSLSTWADLVGEVPSLITKVAQIVGDRLGKRNASLPATKANELPAPSDD
jgi:uncharacterized spore protein YtfJ